GDRAARLQDRFCEVNAREAAADARQLRPDALALVAEAVTLQTLRFFRVEEQLAAVLRVAATGQGRLRQPFEFDLGALAAEAQVKLDGGRRRAHLDEQLVGALGERAGEAVGVDLEGASLVAPMQRFAVEPDLQA